MATQYPRSTMQTRSARATLRAGIAAIILSTLGITGIAAGHQDAARAIDLQRPLTFAIPPQPLADALDQFSRTSNVQVLYGSDLASGQRSSDVEGVWPITTALRMLLQGTGLTARYTSHHDVILTPLNDGAAPASPSPPSGEAALSLRTLYVRPPSVELATPTEGRMAYRLYGGLIRTRIKEALEHDRATGRGNYDVKMGVWVSPAGTVQRVVLLRSGGDADRDRSIERALSGLAIGQLPPADLPQPITLAVQVRTP
jgi:hypothetical protein